MNPKIERIVKEIERAKEKIGEFQAKLRELEQRKTELENTEIVDTVRSMDISLADLAEFLKNKDSLESLATSSQVVPKVEPTFTDDTQEEIEE